MYKRQLKDIPTNHNIYFVAYANGAEPASASSGASVHAKTLSGSIGAANILGTVSYTHLDVYKRQALVPCLLLVKKAGKEECLAPGRCNRTA